MLVRTLSGTPPQRKLPNGTIDTQMHAYLPGFPALPGGPDLPGGDLPTPAQYRQLMAWLGIARVVVTQGNAHQRNNDNLVACLKEFGDIARGVAAVGPDATSAELDSLQEAGVVGLRIMDLPGGGTDLSHLEAIDRMASERDWMVAVQFDGSNIVDHEPRLARMASRWVLDHHGKFFCGVTPDSPQIAAVKRLIDTGKCWFKFAGVYESSKAGGPDFEDVAAVAREIAAYAPERIVWGTNWPHNLARSQEHYPNDAALTDTVLAWLDTEAGLTRALVDNPEELYGFSAWGRGGDP